MAQIRIEQVILHAGNNRSPLKEEQHQMENQSKSKKKEEKNMELSQQRSNVKGATLVLSASSHIAASACDSF